MIRAFIRAYISGDPKAVLRCRHCPRLERDIAARLIRRKEHGEYHKTHHLEN